MTISAIHANMNLSGTGTCCLQLSRHFVYFQFDLGFTQLLFCTLNTSCLYQLKLSVYQQLSIFLIIDAISWCICDYISFLNSANLWQSIMYGAGILPLVGIVSRGIRWNLCSKEVKNFAGV